MSGTGPGPTQDPFISSRQSNGDQSHTNSRRDAIDSGRAGRGSICPHDNNAGSTSPTSHQLQASSNHRSLDIDHRNRSQGNSSAGEDEGTYDDKLEKVRMAAAIVASFHNMNRFGRYCALTWATVVILGGFVSRLTEHDFYYVSALLLLDVEVLFLYYAVILQMIPGRPTKFKKLQEKLHYNLREKLKKLHFYDVLEQHLPDVRVAIQGVQLQAIAVTVVVSVRRLQNLGTKHETTSSDLVGNLDIFRMSLRIFYYMTVVNAAVAVLTILYSEYSTLVNVTSYSLRRYYLELVLRGMDKPTFEVSEHFDFLDFAMRVQSYEYRLDKQPIFVLSRYKDLLQYLHAHKKGFEVARIALDSTDSYMREAAANIVGLWKDFEQGPRPRLFLQRGLLSKLAEAVDFQDRTGRAATLSFEILAKIDPGVLDVETESGKKLIDILINSIEKVVDAQRYDRALIYVKALIPCLGKIRDSLTDQQRRLPILKQKLQEIFTADNSELCLMRTKAVAGHALGLLTDEEPSLEDTRKSLLEHRYSREEYILEDEKEYLTTLLQKVGRNGVPEQPQTKPMPESSQPFKNSASRKTLLSLAVVTAIPVVLLLKFAPFN